MDFEKLHKEFVEKRQVKCPNCGCITEDSCDLGDAGLITYWGEDGPIEYDCPNCESTLLVEESVDRTYEVTMSIKRSPDDQ